ncbi:MarR family winged helix-turn-helix transcriptional regulator [Streptomyces zhihengii]|uniref:MarR family transcriptional regulator n=1 Tax=Streptomyces zhihengii TaxID=1818004 RepID=A0ABS2V2X5_9ACTN|nr:MarR family transcriptional regulator [Streptomyces zhihengii]MBM9624199.1 MarR family transcriptional regulator [Streptomyces zhihengii]
MNEDLAVEHLAEATAVAACEAIELLEIMWDGGGESLAPTAVSVSQLRVLYALERDTAISQRALGGVLGSAPSAVSRLCERLEALGLIRRQRAHTNRRRMELHLTDRGQACLDELRDRRRNALLDAVEAMPASAHAALLEGLTALRHAVGARGKARR